MIANSTCCEANLFSDDPKSREMKRTPVLRVKPKCPPSDTIVNFTQLSGPLFMQNIPEFSIGQGVIFT